MYENNTISNETENDLTDQIENELAPRYNLDNSDDIDEFYDKAISIIEWHGYELKQELVYESGETGSWENPDYNDLEYVAELQKTGEEPKYVKFVMKTTAPSLEQGEVTETDSLDFI